MRIRNEEELSERIDEAVEAIKDNECYKESYSVLSDMKDGMDFYELDEAEETLSEELHEADGAYEMHPSVAALLIDIYEDGIEKKDDKAMCALGSLYYSGRGGEQNYEKAAYYYDMADRYGNRQATENLGYIYYYGRTGEKNYEKAFKYFVKGALDGQITSLYKIGDFYKNGYYVEKDLNEAFLIYKHCEDMLDEDTTPFAGADIYMRIGDCFYSGSGVEKNLLTAHRYMSLAENLFYKRLREGDFYQKRNLEHVSDVLAKIRMEIKENLPDFSWTRYNS